MATVTAVGGALRRCGTCLGLGVLLGLAYRWFFAATCSGRASRTWTGGWCSSRARPWRPGRRPGGCCGARLVRPGLTAAAGVGAAGVLAFVTQGFTAAGGAHLAAVGAVGFLVGAFFAS